MAVAKPDPARSPKLPVLARVLGGGDMTPEVARYVLTLGFTAEDKARMNDLAVRNGDGTLSRDERYELYDYAKAGAVLGALQSKARRLLKRKPAKRRTA